MSINLEGISGNRPKNGQFDNHPLEALLCRKK